MAIEKSLYAAPEGIESLGQPDMPELEIEIEDPESLEVSLDGEPILSMEKGEDEDEFNKNLAEEMDECVQIGRAHV